MVRETRHLWVGNLPDNIREDRIREHFKRYGRVQNVKLLGRPENGSTSVAGTGASGICATVAFMDIKSASKAHNAEHILDERTLTTEYYEPAAIPSTAGAPSAGSSPAGSGYSGSSSSVNSAPAPTPRYHLSGGEESSGATTCPLAASAAAPATWRGTNDSATDYCRRGNTPAAYGRYQRNNSTAPYSTPPSNVERTTPHGRERWYTSGPGGAGAGAGTGVGAGTGAGGESTPSTPGGGTESGRRRRHSGSASSRSDSSSPEPSDTSRASTPATQPPLSHHNNHRTPPNITHQWASTASGRPLAICVRNLPTRSTDSSLKDGLYHEYKKHGKVVWVKVVGQNADRYAVVRFKKPSDVEKALEVSQDKLFFGCKISVAPHQSCDDDAETAKPYETDIDEYHPKATRTLFIGNLEKDVTQQQLRDKFKHFGRIIEIDIKKGSGGGAGYAFCRYASISSVVEAIRAMDGEYVGGSRVKLGFGKPVATACVWVDGLTEHTEKQVLGAVSRCGAATSVCVDRAAGAALVHFEQACAAGAAVRELRRVAAQASAAEPDHPRLCVDYASRECQDAFYEQLEKHGGSAALAGSERLSGDLAARYIPSTRHDSLRYEGCGSRSRASSYSRSTSRTPRYSTIEHYDPVDYAADRRYRVYEEPGSSPPAEEPPYEERLQSVVVSPHRARRHRRDSSPEDRKRSKERHRSGGGVGVVGLGCARRSRSGSGGRAAHGSRRRHRRRRDGSGSRAGTPLRDEMDAPPAEPRRPPRDRPPLPMCLPLPKFAAQLLRSAAPTPRAQPPPAPAPDSPPRPPSASSSSGGSAPHSPSLEERIRSLDEKYEKWSGSRALADAPDRARLRHRLLEVDINEVKPSEVVRSLLAKRSVFDEDSERLEGATRAPSPGERGRSATPRALRYPFPAHAPAPLPGPSVGAPPLLDGDADRPADPRLNRPERPPRPEKLCKISESDYIESRGRPRTPSTDRSQPDSTGQRSPSVLVDLDLESRSRDSVSIMTGDAESKSSFETDDRENVRPCDGRTRLRAFALDPVPASKAERDAPPAPAPAPAPTPAPTPVFVDNDEPDASHRIHSEERCARDVIEMLLKKVESCQRLDTPLDGVSKTSRFHYTESEEHRSLLGSSESKIEVKRIENTKSKVAENNFGNKERENLDVFQNHLSGFNAIICSDKPEIHNDDATRHNDTDKISHIVSQSVHNLKIEKENIQIDKPFDTHTLEEKAVEERNKSDRDKMRYSKDSRASKDKHESDKDKTKHSRHEKHSDKDKKSKDDNFSEKLHNEKFQNEKKNKEDIFSDKFHSDKKSREDISSEKNHTEKKNRDDTFPDKIHNEKSDSGKHGDKSSRDKSDRECEKTRHFEEQKRHDHHRKEKSEKDKRKDFEVDFLHSKSKKDETKKEHKQDKSKKESDSKREIKKEPDVIKSRKSSRDESIREICRKDSTDSSTSRASHESSKLKDIENEIKEDIKPRVKLTDLFLKLDTNRDTHNIKDLKLDKIKTEIKEEKHDISEPNIKPKAELIEKQRHHSVDSPSESKRKERLNSCSSLPSNIGLKRRISSQDSFDALCEEAKKSKNDMKVPERRDSKDSRSGDRHKTAKFNKGHFAKLLESKTKDEKKNQVKPPDDIVETKDARNSGVKVAKKPGKEDSNGNNLNEHSDELRNNLDFLALFELRSSEEDEKQKALKKEMKEKKRLQQLQQIQELQMQQDAMQQGELLGKLKDDRKQKSDEKKRELAREKRFSTDRKSREEKIECRKPKSRRQAHSSDSSDSDEPKKHSIFDIIDDGPTYISMYDKVKARSCKNMQKQEEEKRQEKIKAKFSQLKQSRAKREEKKRSSWDEDSDSPTEHEGRRKTQKSSLDYSSEDSAHHNKKREKLLSSNLDFDDTKSEEYFSTPNDEDLRNKLARKNSRTRIMSDTSDDDNMKNKNHYINECKKDKIPNPESLQSNRIDDSKDYNDDKQKRNSLLNLFGKSDSDDSKLKSSIENESYKSSLIKSLCNDLSSENESISSRNVEVRKKHKKKQKKHKNTYSDDDSKIEHSDASILDSEGKYKNPDKIRRHSSKKDRRKDKFRESIDTDDGRDDKIKFNRDKKLNDDGNCDYGAEVVVNNARRDGKMEDIFGPLSDESDKDATETHKIKSDFSSLGFESFCGNDISINSSEIKNKDDNRRKKEKKRKEKRWFRDDDNSLDVDAVGKAIEARLFETDTLTDDDITIKTKSSDVINHDTNNIKPFENNLDETSKLNNIKNDKLKKENREKKKKKKRSRDERQNRKEHHFFPTDSLDKSDQENTDASNLDTMSNTMLLDIPLPNDLHSNSKQEDTKCLSESSSLPRLTDSPPILVPSNNEADRKTVESCSSNDVSIEDNTKYVVESKDIEIEQIPMPPPYENIVQDISEVPLPADPEPIKSNEIKQETKFDTEKPENDVDNNVSNQDVSQNASFIKNEPDNIDSAADVIDVPPVKLEKKVEEKPRAIISQEETEDAVAALLGESFGGKDNTFSNYEETENSPSLQNDMENTALSTENIPEEDAEEMRQAVQNLNACELELKPDTPVSDNDILLIDTDTEEADEPPQGSTEKLTVNVIPTSQASVTDQPKPSEVTNVNVELTKPKPTPQEIVNTELPSPEKIVTKSNETDVKIQLARRDSVQMITSTATPVITSWTLTNNKTLEPHVINLQPNISNKSQCDNKPSHLTNIVQIKSPQSQNVQISNVVKPVLTPTRVSAPYQVINHVVRPHTSMQPPTIKIPEPHILYQKSQSIVISPRLAGDPRMQSPKTSPQAEGMTSPRLTNMAILSTTPQSLNSTGMVSPNSIHQRSPGQVTVVRMQQPPLSPIQALHMPHGARAMVSPNRPNSVLVQGTPLHFNRLPVTPVLTPISKQININSCVQQKGVGVNANTPLIVQQKIITGDNRKNDIRNISENKNENAKIILSPTSLQHSTNPTVMAQNRLISMQNVHNMNSPLHLANKLVINKMSQINEKRDNPNQKSPEFANHPPFASPPIINVASVNNTPTSIIQSGTKTVVCNIKDTSPINRMPSSNVIHTLNSQRVITPASVGNVIQIDANKVTPSVLSMTSVRPSTVLTKLDTSTMTTVTSNLTNVSPVLIKTSPIGSIKINPRFDRDNIESKSNIIINEAKPEDKVPMGKYHIPEREQIIFPQKSNMENITKCETDFEELLKDNTNEIKVTNNPEKKLEINVGKTTTLITPSENHDKTIGTTEYNEIKKDPDSVPATEKIMSNVSTSPAFSHKEISENLVKCNVTKDTLSENLAASETNKSFQDNRNELVIKEQEIHSFNEKPQKENRVDKSVGNKEQTCGDLLNIIKQEETEKESVSNTNDLNNIKHIDDSDSWNVKDLNIESVIKKVDSLCNDTIDSLSTEDEPRKSDQPSLDSMTESVSDSSKNSNSENVPNDDAEIYMKNSDEDSNFDKISGGAAKRGGRNIRGKKSQKNQDRVQTRQISKTPRSAGVAKRGRGRTKIDKKTKVLANSSANAIPGDVYDFHEDSGDESSTNKAESRPRLILTIKSPLSGHAGVTPTSTLSIAHKEQNKVGEKIIRDEKSEDFVSPSPNTRKSRRLQEKDVHRSVTDEGDDGPQGGSGRAGKRRPTRQATCKATGKATTTSTPLEKPAASAADTRKSPRGNKRMRSLSDTSLDSADGDLSRESKAPRLEEPAAAPPETDQQQAPPVRPSTQAPILPATQPAIQPTIPPAIHAAMQPASQPAVQSTNQPTTQPSNVSKPTIQANVSFVPAAPSAAIVAGPASGATAPPSVSAAPAAPPAPPITSTPITKPPKKMISEISAMLAAGAYETSAQRRGEGPEPARDRDPATGDADAHRIMEPLHGAVMPLGAAEAADARVQSPALPHRPPSVHRAFAAATGRSTPVLFRGGESEGAGAATLARYRAGGGAAGASLPRGAHHPPPPDHHHHHHQQHQHLAHHHHPGAASRITSVPSVSPQGQMAMAGELVRSPPPAHQQTSPVTTVYQNGDGMYPHFSHQHYQMYQQHFRATQHESRATPSPFTRALEAEGSEAPTPPLELRRPPPSARVPRPAHSPSPADRHIMYAVGCGRSPPPAHTSGGAVRLAGALPPGAGAAPGPPHASQVPREADSLQMLLQRYPVMWQGLLALKNDSAAVQMHFVGGNPGVAGDTLARQSDLAPPLLRIAQRMRLEPAQLDQVHRKMKLENEHCILLALPCGRDHMDVLQQSTNLTAGFITYLQRKQAAGIVNIAPPGHHQAMYTVHIFPSCEFANENLNRIAPDLMHRVADIAHLLIVIATV